MRARLERADKVFAYTPSNGTLGVPRVAARLLQPAGDRARARRADRHHRRQRGAALRLLRLHRRRRRRAGRRALLHQLQLVRDDGGRAPGAAARARARTASICRRARPGSAPSRRAPGWCCCAIRTTRPAPSTRATSSRWSPRSAATTASSWSPTRSTASSSTTARIRLSALSLPGFEDHVIVVDSLSKRYSACGIRLGSLATRNGEVYQAALRMAQGRLSPPGLAQLVASGAVELGKEYFDQVVAEYQGRRDLLFDGLTAHPGSLPAQARGRLLLHRPAADPGQRGLRALPARRVRPPAVDRDGRAGARLLRHAGVWATTRCGSPTC